MLDIRNFIFNLVYINSIFWSRSKFHSESKETSLEPIPTVTGQEPIHHRADIQKVPRGNPNRRRENMQTQTERPARYGTEKPSRCEATLLTTAPLQTEFTVQQKCVFSIVKASYKFTSTPHYPLFSPPAPPCSIFTLIPVNQTVFSPFFSVSSFNPTGHIFRNLPFPWNP